MKELEIHKDCMLVDGTWLEVVGRPSFALVAKIHQLLNW